MLYIHSVFINTVFNMLKKDSVEAESLGTSQTFELEVATRKLQTVGKTFVSAKDLSQIIKSRDFLQMPGLFG